GSTRMFATVLRPMGFWTPRVPGCRDHLDRPWSQRHLLQAQPRHRATGPRRHHAAPLVSIEWNGGACSAGHLGRDKWRCRLSTGVASAASKVSEATTLLLTDAFAGIAAGEEVRQRAPLSVRVGSVDEFQLDPAIGYAPNAALWRVLIPDLPAREPSG